MKASVAPATTRKVLAGIDAVLRERTAEAVERVLATASPGYSGYDTDTAAEDLVYHLCKELGVEPAKGTSCFVAMCECFNDPDRDDYISSDHATPGMTDAEEWNDFLADPIHRQRRRYAPWVVSPHLFGGGS